MVVANRGTVFSDDIVGSTDFKRYLKHWLNRARKSGCVTITQGSTADLALVRRDEVRAAYEAMQYGEIVLKFARERLEDRQRDSVVFSWLKYLNDEEREQFEDELLATYFECASVRDWSELENLLEDWTATAYAVQNTELMEAWSRKGRPSNYISINTVNDK